MIASLLVGAVLARVALAEPAQPEAAPAAAPSFPHIRVDREARTVEFDAAVPIDAQARDSRGEQMRVYLEIIACAPDSREHETLLVTSAKPSHIHAALLLIGLEPGRPGSWKQDGEKTRFVKPEGAGVRVEFITRGMDGEDVVASPSSWIVNLKTGARFPEGDWVFAGSRFVVRNLPEGKQERYAADGAGTIIGLHTFGSEVLAWQEGLHPDEAVEEAVWCADPARVPRTGTAVRVRLRPVGKE